MAIKIQTQKPEIPIEIGDLKFSFDVSDESIKRFKDEALKAQKEFHSINIDEDDERALEKAKEVIKRGYETILGKGAFEKIYELSPSVMICMRYFVQIVQGINEELQSMGFSQSQQDLAKKYIRSKKK